MRATHGHPGRGLLLGAALLAAGCTTVHRDAIPGREPDITGVITAFSTNELRVEAVPGDTAASPKAVLRLTERTRVLLPNGARELAAQLRQGQRVRVWFDGPVLQSYPVRGGAGTIVIDGTYSGNLGPAGPPRPAVP